MRRRLKRCCSFKTILFFFLFAFFFSIFNWTATKLAVRDLIYILRPVWDKPDRPWKTIPHYYSFGVNTSQLCELHQWKKRTDDVKVIDAVIFSIELDLLEIRMKELWEHVDHFVVLEADKTFTGKPKRLYLKENLEKFSWAKEKLIHETFSGLSELKPRESPFVNEGRMRRRMTEIIDGLASKGDVIICSDVDEVPSAHTVQLLKECEGYPNNLHLQLRMYMYSFEFFRFEDTGKTHVAKYRKHLFEYRHARMSDNLLTDSGWHCSFCFRYISDFIFKMTSYSHNERVTHEKLLEEKEIQRKICDGDDIFDMYPEVYSFREMVQKFGRMPKTKVMTGLPKHLVENPKKFAFLLPDGCVREDYNNDTIPVR